MILWHIWLEKNRVLYERKSTEAEDILKRALSQLEICRKSWTEHHDTSRAETGSRPKWEPPEVGAFKVNVDAALEQSKARTGIIIRNEQGEIIAAMACPKVSTKDSKFMEAVAIAQGIQLVKETGISGFLVESDCMAVVNQINRSTEDFSNIGHVVQWIKAEMKHPGCRGISHAKRDCNVPAHLLAKHACTLENTRVWLEEGPDCITSTVLNDAPI